MGNLGGLRHIFIIAFNSMILYDALTSEEAFSVRFNLKYIEGISCFLVDIPFLTCLLALRFVNLDC